MSFEAIAPPKEVKAELVTGNGNTPATHQGVIELAIQRGTPVETQELTERERFCKALRDCADFFESRPEVAIPVSMNTFYLFPKVEDIAAYAKAFGNCRKSGDDNFFNLTKQFGSAIEVQAAWYRNRVCERVVVGKKKVEVPVMQEVGKRVEEQEIVEWKCPKVLQPLAPPEVMEEIAAESSNDIPF